MNTARTARDHIEADNAVIRVRTKDGLVRIQATVKGSGANSDRTLIFPAITPVTSLLLARRLTQAAGDAAQPALAFGSQRAGRTRFSAADVAEMRRLRAGGMKLKVIAARYGCTVSAVAYQTGGIIDPAANHWNRRDPNTLDTIVRMHGEGESVGDIARRLHCSESGVRAVLRRHREGQARPVPRPGPVQQMPLLLRPTLVRPDKGA